MTSDFQNYLNYLNIILRKQNLLTFTYLKKESLDLFDLSDSALFEVTSGVVAVQPRLLEPVAQPMTPLTTIVLKNQGRVHLILLN